METKKITPEMYEKLKAPLPAAAVKQHPTKTFLSSIKAIYVTERLNDVFGCGSWRVKVDHVVTSDKSMVVIKTTFEIPEYGVYYESYGGNDNGGENSKNFDLGDAFKGATTDALTKIGSYMGIAIEVFKGNGNAQPPAAPAKQLTAAEVAKFIEAARSIKDLSDIWKNNQHLHNDQKTLELLTAKKNELTVNVQ